MESNAQSPVRGLVAAAAVVIVVAGLREADEIFLPLLIAMFLSILTTPAVRFLVRVGIPRAVAVMTIVVVVAGALVGGTTLLADTVRRFATNLPQYQGPLNDLLALLLVRAKEAGILVPENVQDTLDPSAMFPYVRQTLAAVLGVLSQVFIIILYTAFMLFETVQLEEKIQAAFGEVSTTLLQGGITVQRYLAIKTAASMATGLIIGVGTYFMGLDFYLLWGVLAFLLNYIPSIGSILAAVPAVALAMIQLGMGWAIAVALLYILVNVTIGNVIEPRILGRRLGLSPLVVVVSLFFWGWVWGPMGMLVGVPMTVVVKLLLEVSAETRWIAVLLGGARDAKELVG